MDCVPSDRPVILAANHPTAFMEPCILACFMDRPLHFLVRGDFFKNPFFAFLLRSLNMLPVYRLKDGGYKGLKNNYSTFEACHKALAAGKTLMILAEGTSIHEKRLRPIQKGTARIALGALEQYSDLEIAIVPVGVNYTYADRFRSDVMIDFCEPISSKAYFEAFQENANVAISAFTEELTQRLESSVIIIEKEKDEALCEHLFVLDRSERLKPHWPVINNSRQALESEKRIADAVNAMPNEKKVALEKNLELYFNQLQSLNLLDQTIKNKPPSLQERVLLFLGFIPFLIGYLFNYLPLRLARLIADTQVKAIEFYSPVMLAVGVGSYLVYLVLWMVLIMVFSSWKLLLFALFTPFLGLWALYFPEPLTRYKQSLRWHRLPVEIKEKITTLRQKIIIDK